MKRLSFLCTLLFALAVSVLPAASARAQTIYTGDGWEAVFKVELRGGDATYKGKRNGILVLTDSTIALHDCAEIVNQACYYSDKKKAPFTPTPFYSIKLLDVKGVASSSDWVRVTYETKSSVEVPTFAMGRSYGPAIDAKIRFRLKKLGVTIPE